MEWKTVKLGEVGKVVTGKTPRTSIADNYGGSIPFLTPSDDLSQKFAPATNKTITEQGLREVKNCLIPANSICVSCIGSDLGKVVMNREPLVTNQQINSIIPNEDIDAHFVYYAMIEIGKLLNHLSKTSTAVPIINKSTFCNMEISLPPLETQRRIAEILSSLDDKIENNNRINRNLEAQAQALFKSWFVDFEPFGGTMPEDWREGTLGDICTIKYGKGLSKNLLTDEGYPVFGGNGVIGYYTKFLYEQPQILVSCRGAASGKIMESDPQSFVTSNSLVLEMERRDFYHYLKYLLLANPLYNYATGSAQPQITIDNIKDVKVLLPSIDVVNSISEKFAAMDELVRSLKRESQKLATLRDTLLPKLMKGEIAV